MDFIKKQALILVSLTVLPLLRSIQLGSKELRYLQEFRLFDRKAWLLLELNGVDAKNFLQGMVSADLEKLKSIKSNLL